MPTITLYQQTPMIHFQGGQAGATLRATDVKPRLDRWLVDHHPNLIPPEWYALAEDDRQRSLNYRLRIIPGPISEAVDERREKYHGKDVANGRNNYPNYFADVGRGESPRKFSFYQYVQLEFTTPIPGLEALFTDANLAPFFQATNFGTRASKGFGSFTPAVRPQGWVFKFKVNDSNVQRDDYLNLFLHLQFFNRSVRTGLNKFPHPETGGFQQTFYMKPLIFSYAVSKDIVWEKKLVKEAAGGGLFFDRDNPRRPSRRTEPEQPEEGEWPAWYDPNEARKATVRDVMGLSTNQTWGHYGNMTVNKTSSQAGNDHAYDRAPSPFTLVPIRMEDGFGVYVYVQEPAQEYLQHTFNVEARRNQVGGQPLPVFPDFSMREFLQVHFTPQEIYDSVVMKNTRNDEPLRDKLVLMYTQIQQSLNLNNIQPA
jgi:hypothetical protein